MCNTLEHILSTYKGVTNLGLANWECLREMGVACSVGVDGEVLSGKVLREIVRCHMTACPVGQGAGLRKQPNPNF